MLFTIRNTLTLVLLSTSSLLTNAQSTTVSVSYDENYDSSDLSLAVVACSDGSNGLIHKGYDTAGSLPPFPNIGAFYTVENWNSPNCGKCYQITFNENGNQIYALAVDKAGAGSVNLSKTAMNTLTDGLAEQIGRVDMEAEEVGLDKCQMPA
ncbi:hypothetical protein AJ80_07243 [Polytolypa hystricis UAMH7299]|uniref:Uncharacterized protein n=1 Tax=Polytolypa hystricis (strain UAMH7299) TaxID=1447883 RepID=A0A2B7XQU9_POLH7|nr:hypothetical protein AJ80_07243 [Polytolypa hystricis UAMH7299]